MKKLYKKICHGKKYGCHTCGTKMTFKKGPFIADHAPPRAIVANLCPPGHSISKPKALPQCDKCSLQQAASVRKLLRRHEGDKTLPKNPFSSIEGIKTHGFSHFYFLLPYAFLFNFLDYYGYFPEFFKFLSKHF